jgi:hypothetical protein
MDRPFPKGVAKSLSRASSIPRPKGGFSVVLLLGVLFLTFGGAVNAARAANKLFVFHGKIKAVDTAARTFTLQAKKQSYVFVITDRTRIVRNGKAQKFADLKQGQLAEVEMQIGPGGKGMAVSVKLGFYTSRELDIRAEELKWQSWFSATTPSGKTLYGRDFVRLIAHLPLWEPIAVPTSGPVSAGLFRLSVRPEGTISNVEILHSTGDKRLDEWTMRWAKKWRFRPNSVVQARIASP